MTDSSHLILVVEDEPDGLDVLRRALNLRELHSELYDNAEIAYDALMAAPEQYAAVVIDLALPQMDGFQLMRLIRAHELIKHLPLIAITAFHTPELRIKALEGGFDNYFEKPIKMGYFLDMLTGYARS
jgi:DNA-binding response OmpR family regulator